MKQGNLFKIMDPPYVRWVQSKPGDILMFVSERKSATGKTLYTCFNFRTGNIVSVFEGFVKRL